MLHNYKARQQSVFAPMRLLLIFGGLLTRVDFLAEPGDETVLLK